MTPHSTPTANSASDPEIYTCVRMRAARDEEHFSGAEGLLPGSFGETALADCTDGPVPFTALLTMNLLEVSNKSEHMSFFLSSALTWLRRQPDHTRLWVDTGLGVRLVK